MKLQIEEKPSPEKNSVHMHNPVLQHQISPKDTISAKVELKEDEWGGHHIRKQKTEIGQTAKSHVKEARLCSEAALLRLTRRGFLERNVLPGVKTPGFSCRSWVLQKDIDPTMAQNKTLD